MITWNEFTSIPNGTQVLNHGWDQCVALANLYHEGVIGGSFVPVASAYQWWTLFGLFPTLYQNYTQSYTPVPGAIFIARYGVYNAPDGHIGVVTGVNPNGTFNTMEQNAGTWRYVGRYTRSMSNVLGFLIPKNNPASGTPNPGPAPTPTLPVEEDHMPDKYIWKKEGGKLINAIFNTESGFFHPFDSSNGEYNTNIAKTFGVVTPSAGISSSHFAAIQRDVDAVRKRK